MAKIDTGLTILTIIIVIFTVFLVIVGESRPDAYISVSILLYFVYTAMDPGIRRYANMRPLDIGLIIVFIFIVMVRVLDILGVV
ncbi:MAG: hypothetical protein QXJ56_07750 [Ignisphaera sp.]|uniref:Uncharacterized protein n=1 Tax=Ignisphaera aggregans TaxID=334771 RepID=A0A7J3I8L4_9CREN